MVGKKADLVITRRSGGQQDENTGTYEPADEEVVYDSTVTWQEGVSNKTGERIESQLGLSVADVEYTLYLTLEDKISDLRLQDRGLLTLPDGEEIRVEIIGRRKLDSSIFVDRY